MVQAMIATMPAPVDAPTGAHAGIYGMLGIKTFINASGHNTAQGGSLMPPEVLAALNEGARHYVPLRELQDAAGRHIAETIGVPAALVSAGAASAILLGAAGALTGTDTSRVYALPDILPGGRNEFLVWKTKRPNYMYQAVQAAGGKLIELGESEDGPVTPQQFADAINERTAGVLLVLAPVDQGREHTGGWEQFIGAIAASANRAGVPVLVDAASELPPRNLPRRLLDLGVAGIIVSGGKVIRGPQSTGLLLGRPDLIKAAALNNNPLQAIGRPMKVGKEELCALVAAVDRFFAMDEAAQLAGWHEDASQIATAARALPGVSAEVVAGNPHYGRPPLAPKAMLRFAGGAAAADRLAEALYDGTPGVRTLRYSDAVIFNPMTLHEGEVEAIVRRLHTLAG